MNSSGGDRYVRITTQEKKSICEKITGGLASVLIGLALIIVAIGLLFYNEGRAVQTSQSLEEGLSLVLPLPTAEVAFRENNGKLVYLSGPLKSEKPVIDSHFGISVHAAKLKRKVWMFQWVEDESKREIDRGDHMEVETSYSYYTAWREDLVNSRQFDSPHSHQNPSTFPLSSKEEVSANVQIGNFMLSASQIGKISNYERYKLDASNVQLTDSKARVWDDHIYMGDNPSQPQVGDVKIEFSFAGSTSQHHPDSVSVIAAQQGTTFRPYETRAGDHLHLLYMGRLTPQEMFKAEQQQNAMMTWALRAAGWLLMFIAFTLTTNIVNILVSWIPIVRDLVAFGTLSLSFALASSLSALVIALGWIRYRPWISATILVIAAAPTVINWMMRRSQRKKHT